MHRVVRSLAILCFAVIVSFPAVAKDGIKATVHTPIPAAALEGSEVEIQWTLAEEKSGDPFNASTVFVRLIGPKGNTTEAFAEFGAHTDGRYLATASIPKGGVSAIEIGVAGTMTDRDGNSWRSDWLMDLANDPIED